MIYKILRLRLGIYIIRTLILLLFYVISLAKNNIGDTQGIKKSMLHYSVQSPYRGLQLKFQVNWKVRLKSIVINSVLGTLMKVM